MLSQAQQPLPSLPSPGVGSLPTPVQPGVPGGLPSGVTGPDYTPTPGLRLPSQGNPTQPVNPLPTAPSSPAPFQPQPETPPNGQVQAPEQPASLEPGQDVEQRSTPPESTTAPRVVAPLSSIERIFATQTLTDKLVLRQFGYDLFARVPTTFAPVTDVPVGPDYVIGPGDSLNIVLWGGAQDAYQVVVDRNGAIVLPRLGVFQVWGLTLNRLQELLQQRFAEFFPDFQMAVTLGKLRTLQVYVVGEVEQPGAYTVSSLSTMINALFASGGPTRNGSLRHIQLVRQGRRVHTLDLYDFLLQGNKSQDQTLQSGDTLFVPKLGPAAGVAGEVRRPAIYEFEPGTTLKQLLELSGGITPLGYLQRIQVERVVANQRRIVVDLDLAASQERPALAALWQTPIVEYDLVRVFSISQVLENIVTLEGHVIRPGRYELKRGMRLHDLLPSYQDVLPEVHLDYAEIVRLVEPDLHRIVVPFNLGALLAGDPTHDLLLQPQDTVRIFAKTAFAPPPKVTIRGEVRQPDTYPLLGSMRIKDLVARAGWITKQAYLERAEILRVTAKRDLISLPFHLGLALEGQERDNLLLQDEDQVVIHNIFEHKFVSNVSISGLVHKPGTYPLTESMRVSDLVFQAGGTAKFAYLEKAELTRHRITQDGDVAIRMEIDLALALAGNAEHNLFLQDFDQLLVRAIPDIELSRTVEILGEVRFPGAYPILKGERLSTVLRRAGGFTPEAYLRGAVLVRDSVREIQEKRLQDLIRQEEETLLSESADTQDTSVVSAGTAAVEERQDQAAFMLRRNLLNRLRTVRPDGRLVVSLQPLDLLMNSPYDIELEPGDRLSIPSTPKYINVVGEIYNRVSLLYSPNDTIADYINKVGGVKPDADEDQIYLVQIDGTVVSNTQSQFAIVLASGDTMYFKDFFDVIPQPGDTIIVPRRIKQPATLRTIRDIVQIVFQSVASVGVIAALF